MCVRVCVCVCVYIHISIHHGSVDNRSAYMIVPITQGACTCTLKFFTCLGLGAAWFGAAFTFLIFYNFFNILTEALLALARSYGQTRTEELSSWKLFNRGKTYLVPSILTFF